MEPTTLGNICPWLMHTRKYLSLAHMNQMNLVGSSRLSQVVTVRAVVFALKRSGSLGTKKSPRIGLFSGSLIHKGC